jgi:uncharacterized protein
MMETLLPSLVEQTFFDDLRRGAYLLHWDERDIDRIQHLTRKYADLSLGFADAAVVACAERHGGRALSTDFRHFPVVARGEGTFTVLPMEDAG